MSIGYRRWTGVLAGGNALCTAKSAAETYASCAQRALAREPGHTVDRPEWERCKSLELAFFEAYKSRSGLDYRTLMKKIVRRELTAMRIIATIDGKHVFMHKHAIQEKNNRQMMMIGTEDYPLRAYVEFDDDNEVYIFKFDPPLPGVTVVCSFRPRDGVRRGKYGVLLRDPIMISISREPAPRGTIRLSGRFVLRAINKAANLLALANRTDVLMYESRSGLDDRKLMKRIVHSELTAMRLIAKIYGKPMWCYRHAMRYKNNREMMMIGTEDVPLQAYIESDDDDDDDDDDDAYIFKFGPPLPGVKVEIAWSPGYHRIYISIKLLFYWDKFCGYHYHLL